MTCLKENWDKYCFKLVTTALGEKRISSRCKAGDRDLEPCFLLRRSSQQPGGGRWSLCAMKGSPAQMHAPCPHLCLKELCHGVPPNPVSPPKPHSCLRERLSCYCRRKLWIKQWWRLYKYRAIYSHCISTEIPSETLAVRAPLGGHRLHAEAKQLTLLVPAEPLYIAAAASLTLHSCSPPCSLYFPPITAVPAWLFLQTKFPGMNWTGFVAKKLSTAVEIWTGLCQSTVSARNPVNLLSLNKSNIFR